MKYGGGNMHELIAESTDCSSSMLVNSKWK